MDIFVCSSAWNAGFSAGFRPFTDIFLLIFFCASTIKNNGKICEKLRKLIFCGNDIDKKRQNPYDEFKISSTFPVAPEGNFFLLSDVIVLASIRMIPNYGNQNRKQREEVLCWRKSSVFSMSRPRMQNV